jgi:sugar/nucleoside kinase (ribokinase family)
MKIDVLAIGELLADLISHEHVNTLSEARNFQMFQGGSPANLCANVKWLGKRAELVACIGNDNIGKFLTNEIEKIGINTNHIALNDEYPTSIVLVGKSMGTPDFIAYRMADAQLPAIDDHLLLNVNIIHTSAFALSKNPARINILQAIKHAVSLGSQLSVDWNFAQPIWGNDNGRSTFNFIMSLNPLLKMSMDDFQRFTNMKNPSEEDAKLFLDQLSNTFMCLTCGSKGVWYKYKNKWNFKPAQKVNEVKDTTGAGDAFWAAFLVQYLNTQNIEDAIQFAIEIAAQKVQTFGPLYFQKKV